MNTLKLIAQVDSVSKFETLDMEGMRRHNHVMIPAQLVTVEVTDEQMQYLRHQEETLDEPLSYVSLDELREDFQEIYRRIATPLLDQIRAMYRSYGYDEAYTARMIDEHISVDVHVLKEGMEDEPVREVDTYIEDGLVISRYGAHGGRCIVACLDKDIEVVRSDAESVGDRAFMGCRHLREVHLPRVDTLGDCAFCECTMLRKVELSDHLSRIPLCAFSGCHMLDEFRLPKSLIQIDSDAFADCLNLRTLLTHDGQKLASIAGLPSHIDRHPDSFIDTPVNPAPVFFSDLKAELAEIEDELEYEEEGTDAYNELLERYHQAQADLKHAEKMKALADLLK